MSGMRFTDDMDMDEEIDRYARLLKVATDIYTTMVLSSGPPGMLIRQDDYERLEAVLAEFGNETAIELHGQRGPGREGLSEQGS